MSTPIRIILWALYVLILGGSFYLYITHKNKVTTESKTPVKQEKLVIESNDADINMVEVTQSNDRKIVLNISCSNTNQQSTPLNLNDSTTNDSGVSYAQEEFQDLPQEENSRNMSPNIIQSKVIESKVIYSTID